jgi:hypothetical protein
MHSKSQLKSSASSCVRVWFRSERKSEYLITVSLVHPFQRSDKFVLLSLATLLIDNLFYLPRRALAQTDKTKIYLLQKKLQANCNKNDDDHIIVALIATAQQKKKLRVDLQT